VRARIVALLVGVAVAAAVPAAQPLAQPSHGPAVAIVAKPCSKGYTHAIIGGEHKCLRRGQFCSKSHRKQYRKYGFRCVWDGQYYRLK
jgi:hypothetical protein